jgi:hypothetical protein
MGAVIGVQGERLCGASGSPAPGSASFRSHSLLLRPWIFQGVTLDGGQKASDKVHEIPARSFTSGAFSYKGMAVRLSPKTWPLQLGTPEGQEEGDEP